MYSFGFQQAYRRGMEGRDRIFLDKVRMSIASLRIAAGTYHLVAAVLPIRDYCGHLHDR